MQERARFQKLTQANHPKNGELILLLIDDGIIPRPWIAISEYQKFLDGERLATFYINDRREGPKIAVLDARVLGWCPIDVTIPK